MKAALCVFLLVVATVAGAEEKKNEKRGVLGLGYGIGAPAPLLGHGYYGHGLGLYNHGLGYGGLGYGGGGLGYAGGLGYGGYGGYYGGYSGLGHGLGHAPLLGHSLSYSAPLVSHAPLLGLGHGGWH